VGLHHIKEIALKKNHPTRRPRTRLSDSEKQAIRAHYYALRDEWCLELEEEQIDWQFLFDLHWEMYQLEHQHPWLKKAVA
jgi:hypothetical protein